MAREINFVQSRRNKLTKSQELDRRIFRISAAVFAIAIGGFLIALGINFYLKFQISSLENQQRNMEAQVLDQEQTEQSILVTSEKLKVLAELFALRFDKQAAIEYFSQIFGSDVMIKDIKYESDAKILSLRLQANSIFILERTFAQLANPEVAAQFGQVNKSELIRTDDGRYSMAITINLESSTSQAATQP